MRILHLEASSGWGGQEIRVLREAEGMRERGHVVILGVTKGGGLVSRAREAGFSVYELNFKRPFWIICLMRLALIIKQNDIDLVNTHSSLDSWIGGFACRIAGKAIVRTRHLSTPIKPGWNSRILYGKLADFVVTTCSSIIPMICRQSGKSEKMCRSIPTGVDPSRIIFKQTEVKQFRKSIGVEEGDFLIGTACFMRSWKGIDDFLKAALSLKGNANLKWVIIGGGHAETYKNRAKSMGLDGVVLFSGHLDNPYPALQALDVFALLSTAHEGVSQAILQAAYLGKPLVATSTGGLAEVCLHKVTGLKVAPFSPQEVAQSVLELKEDSQLCRRLGEKARELVMERFTLAGTLDQMEEVYRHVLGRK